MGEEAAGPVGHKAHDGAFAARSDPLNAAQRAAATYGLSSPDDPPPPLLIIAGAGTGKTRTLAHRVAQAVLTGFDPGRILLLTFTRRAAAEMLRQRLQVIQDTTSDARFSDVELGWAGTFHAIGCRLLRAHASSVRLDPAFTVLDRSDAADLLDLARVDLGLSETTSPFPKKNTCLTIYSQAINRNLSLAELLHDTFPTHERWIDKFRQLFRRYADTKTASNVLDFDDLLLYWSRLFDDRIVAKALRARFDLILVDEYQDTNALQGEIVRQLKPDGHGVTVVGDEAQSIYGFRGARVQNILEFPHSYDPPATIITLEENYRSTQPILDACNSVLSLARQRFEKHLVSERRTGAKPTLVTVDDSQGEAQFVVEHVLAHRENGRTLDEQAVLFRAAHHSARLEVELTRYGIPFVKYGGRKFLDAAHVKDVLAVLRWAENPKDEVAAFRALQLVPGIGPKKARGIYRVVRLGGEFSVLLTYSLPKQAAEVGNDLFSLLRRFGAREAQWPGQTDEVCRWYEPIMPYEDPEARRVDLDLVTEIAAGHHTRHAFLTDLALDPIEGGGRGSSRSDERLVLSTIHSAKGLEWPVVFILNVAEGGIPSPKADRPEEIEEERRLLYVAMTRAQNDLYLVHPLRPRLDRPTTPSATLVPRTRFLPDAILAAFEEERVSLEDTLEVPSEPVEPAFDVAAAVRQMWS